MYPEAPVYQFPEDIIIRNMGAAKIVNNCITSGAIHRLPSVNKIEEEREEDGAEEEGVRDLSTRGRK